MTVVQTLRNYSKANDGLSIRDSDHLLVRSIIITHSSPCYSLARIPSFVAFIAMSGSGADRSDTLIINSSNGNKVFLVIFGLGNDERETGDADDFVALCDSDQDDQNDIIGEEVHS